MVIVVAYGTFEEVSNKEAQEERSDQTLQPGAAYDAGRIEDGRGVWKGIIVFRIKVEDDGRWPKNGELYSCLKD